jgi:hypothetical protein
MTTKMKEAGFEVVECRGFNRLGSLGWYVSGNWLKRTSLSAGQMKTYERLLPVAKLIEGLPLLPHLSVIAVGRKPAAAEPRCPETEFQAGVETPSPAAGVLVGQN